MKIPALALGMAIALASGMAHAATPEQDASQHQMAMQPDAGRTTHQSQGMLKAINAKAGKVQIAHEAIPGLGWPPMTMWFALHDPLPRDIKVGDAVRFELAQEKSGQWVIVKIGHK